MAQHEGKHRAESTTDRSRFTGGFLVSGALAVGAMALSQPVTANATCFAAGSLSLGHGCTSDGITSPALAIGPGAEADGDTLLGGGSGPLFAPALAIGTGAEADTDSPNSSAVAIGPHTFAVTLGAGNNHALALGPNDTALAGAVGADKGNFALAAGTHNYAQTELGNHNTAVAVSLSHPGPTNTAESGLGDGNRALAFGETNLVTAFGNKNTAVQVGHFTTTQATGNGQTKITHTGIFKQHP